MASIANEEELRVGMNVFILKNETFKVIRGEQERNIPIHDDPFPLNPERH